jgi:hypothetical protein
MSLATVATKTTKNTNETNEVKCVTDFKMKKSNKFFNLEKEDDLEKNDIISVEDEIYNLAFRPAFKRIISSKSKIKFNSQFVNSTRSIIQAFNSNTSTRIKTKTNEKSDEFYVKFLQEHFDFNSNLLKMIGRDLLDQGDDMKTFNYLKVSQSTFETVISNLTSFARYIVSVNITECNNSFFFTFKNLKFRFKIVACQNYTKDLLKFSKSFQNTDSKEAFSSHVNFFPLENYCSKASLLTFRSLPNG